MPVEFIIYAQIASILGYVGIVFGLYRLLMAQKDGVIALLRFAGDRLSLRLSKNSDVLKNATSSIHAFCC